MSRRPSLTIVEAGARMRQQVLVNHLTELRLTAFIEHFDATAQTAAQANWSHEHYLAVLAEQEVDRRTQNRRKRRIQEARFPLPRNWLILTLPPSPNSTRRIFWS